MRARLRDVRSVGRAVGRATCGVDATRRDDLGPRFSRRRRDRPKGLVWGVMTRLESRDSPNESLSDARASALDAARRRRRRRRTCRPTTTSRRHRRRTRARPTDPVARAGPATASSRDRNVVVITMEKISDIVNDDAFGRRLDRARSRSSSADSRRRSRENRSRRRSRRMDLNRRRRLNGWITSRVDGDATAAAARRRRRRRRRRRLCRDFTPSCETRRRFNA